MADRHRFRANVQHGIERFTRVAVQQSSTCRSKQPADDAEHHKVGVLGNSRDTHA